jgi:hypothetical protein
MQALPSKDATLYRFEMHQRIDFEEGSMKQTIYDPPSGWRYGFPKPYNPLPGENINQTLLRDGYPQNEIDRSASMWGGNSDVPCRFWEVEIPPQEPDCQGSSKIMSDYPSIEQQISELKAAGWKRGDRFRDLWHSPEGRLFLGPHGAWKVMKGLSAGTEYSKPVKITKLP